MEKIRMECIDDDPFELLDRTGASEDSRQFTQEFALHSEIILTALADEIECYYVGSYGEGTTTTSLGSDDDFIYCYYSRLVYENPPYNSDDHEYFLICRDSKTKPGYVFLKPTTGKVPQTAQHSQPADESVNELYETHARLSANIYENLFRNGPAETRYGTEGERDTDIVFAYKSETIPSFARQWLYRMRCFNWPSSDQLSEFESSECFFVGAGHPYSDIYRREREWRISFTVQERQLMNSLNSTQHKCYILLKMVKKNIIQESIGESITSYHCKTALFYTIENSPCEFWVPENLVKCVNHCIFRLLIWSVLGHCPNYFIQDENMFDKTECRNKLHKIRDITLRCLQNRSNFFFESTSDHGGNVHGEYIAGKSSPDNISLKRMEVIFIMNIHIQFVRRSLNMRNELLSRVKILPGRPKPSVQLQLEIDRRKEKFNSTTKVKQHTKTAVNQAFEQIVLFINLQKAQDLASDMCYSQYDDASRTQKYLTYVVYFTNESRSWDALSADLIVATCYYRLDMFGKCRDKLTHSLKRDSYVVSRCNCSQTKYPSDIFEQSMDDHFSKDRPNIRIMRKEYRQKYVSTCLVFLPNQRHIVHPVLHLEMLRLFGKTSNDGQEAWHAWIMIDSKIYFYFLKYLLHTKLEDMTQKQAAIDDMRFILEKDRHLGHRETAYNVLSYIYRQENKIAEAHACLRKSWKVKSGHNAAKWHSVLLLWDLWKVRNENEV